jgi:4-oxalocrotonate tautomerase
MPIVTITMYEGRTIDQKRKLVRAVTDAVVQSLGPPATYEGTRIIIHEIPKQNFASAGVLASDKK